MLALNPPALGESFAAAAEEVADFLAGTSFDRPAPDEDVLAASDQEHDE